MINFDWSSLLLFSGVMNAILVSLLLLSRRERYSWSFKLWIFLLQVSIAAICVERMVRFSGLVEQFPEILFTTSPLFFFILPLIYTFQRSLLGTLKYGYTHFIIPFLFLLLLVPTLGMSKTEKLKMYNTEGLNDPVWLLFFYLIYALFYIANIFYLNQQHKRALYNEYADPAIHSQLFFNRIVFISSVLTITIPLALATPLVFPEEQELVVFEKLLFVAFSFSPHLILIALLDNKILFQTKPMPPKAKKSEPTPIENLTTLKTQLLRYMEQEKPYLNQNLTLQDLAKQLHFSRSQLSSIINQGTQQNYYDFINQYRLDALVEKIKAKEHKVYSLDHLALESGFKSYVSFYRVFKKKFQQSPKAYIKALENKS